MNGLGWRTRLSIRRTMLEVRIVHRFGHRHECGCMDFLRSRRIWCWEHGMAQVGQK